MTEETTINNYQFRELIEALNSINRYLDEIRGRILDIERRMVN